VFQISGCGGWRGLCCDLNCWVPQPFTFLAKGACWGPIAQVARVNSYTKPRVLGTEVYTSVSLECRKRAQHWMVSNKFSN
jgi:hypothetical protein